MNDLTVVYYSADAAPKRFLMNLRSNLSNAIVDLPLVVIKQKPDVPRSHLQIYRNALAGAKEAKTKYIALAEDDVLYTPSHFEYRPKSGVFGYNMNVWSIFTWDNPPIFSYKDRINFKACKYVSIWIRC